MFWSRMQQQTCPASVALLVLCGLCMCVSDVLCATPTSSSGKATPGGAEDTDAIVLRIKTLSSDENGIVYAFMDESRVVTFDVVYSCSNDTNILLNISSPSEDRDVLKVDALKIKLRGRNKYTDDTSSNTNNSSNASNTLTTTTTNIPAIHSTTGTIRDSTQKLKFVSLRDTLSENGGLCSREVNVTLHGALIGTSSVDFEAIRVNSIPASAEEKADTLLSVESDITSNNTDSEPESNKTNATIHRVTIDVHVVRDIRFIDTLFVVCVYVLEILEMLAFGSQLDLTVVTKTLKKPLAPIIGLVCQYVGMPLIAYAIAKVVASDSLSAVGIFAAGICPGGGTSNIYAYLLDGDLSLSITMTTISTVLSLGMMPLWLYTLGREFYQDYDVGIPYVDILVTLSVILVPLSVGLLIKHKCPNFAKFIEKIATALVTVLAILLIVTGIYSSLYIFKLFNVKIIIIGCALPYIGFILGCVVAYLCKQSVENIKTIGIEIGMQNTAIAMILLLNSFPAPLGDIATVAPISAEVMSPIPPLIISFAYLIYKKCCRGYSKVEKKERTLGHHIDAHEFKDGAFVDKESSRS